MEIMWAPWRGDYIAGTADQPQQEPGGCVFCEALTAESDLDRYIIHRGKHVFVIMNLFPYNNGHLLVIPNKHISKVSLMDPETRYEMMDFLVKAEQVLGRVYHPHGVNIGANIGAAAGAGIAQHVHFHVLPRWNADSNFMTTVANTRVIPEALEVTWEKIRKAWDAENP